MEGSPRRAKLGLALAGGGFRASLFHLGVLRRMAELDLLRYVEVLSTVSGGSIIGALYLLLLKHRLETAASQRLSRDEYVELVADLEGILVQAVAGNLRTRLLMNPLTVLRVLLTPRTLGQAMGRLYERHLYRAVTELADFQQRQRLRAPRPGAVLLREMRIRPGGQEIRGGIEAYNADPGPPGGVKPGSAVTNLIINATSLNSGARFWFSAVEVGDWYLGHVRHGEIEELLGRKYLLQASEGELARLAAGAAPPAQLLKAQLGHGTLPFAEWWRGRGGRAAIPAAWASLFEVPEFPGRLADREASLGSLRLAKVAAWYLLHGRRMSPQVTGGVPPEQHWLRFWAALDAIDDKLATALRVAKKARGADWGDLLLEFVLEVHGFRSAEIVSPDIEQFWARLTLGDAVAASACFPPVFSPIVMPRLYDDWYVSRLGLSDGGVFDNIGLTALLDEQCNYVIASDTSGLLGLAERAATGRLGMSARITSVLMEALAGRQRDQLQERRRFSRQATALKDPPEWRDFHAVRELHALAFFHIKSPRIRSDGLVTGLDPDDLARIRTDLDGFGEVEIAALVNHGYDMADRYLREYFAGTPYCNMAYWTPPVSPPRPLLVDQRARRILLAGRARFFRALRLGNPVSWGLAVASVVLVVWLTRASRVSLSSMVTDIAVAGAKTALDWLDPIGAGWTSREFPGWVLVLVAILAVALVVLWRGVFERLTQQQALQWARRLAIIGRGVRGYAANVLWLLPAAPVALALTTSAAAWVSHLGFHLPFRWSARVRAVRRDGNADATAAEGVPSAPQGTAQAGDDVR